MNKGELALKLIKPWVEKIGPSKAIRRLYIRGVSYSTAEQIVRGTYPCTPKFRIAEIILTEIGIDDNKTASRKSAS